MATNPTDGTSRSLIDRAKNIILSPRTEWPVIDAEPSTIRGIYMSYVVILAAIGPLATAIGQFVFGYRFFGIVYRPSPVHIIVTAIFTYVFSLVAVYIVALIIDALAPSFGGTKDPVKAFKVAAYSWTAGWVAAVIGIIPQLSMLAWLGVIYGFYILYVGLPVLMKTTADKAVVYTLVIFVAAVVVLIVLGMITGVIVAAVSPMPLTGGGSLSIG